MSLLTLSEDGESNLGPGPTSKSEDDLQGQHIQDSGERHPEYIGNSYKNTEMTPIRHIPLVEKLKKIKASAVFKK